MKLITLSLLLVHLTTDAQTIAGKWKTIDDNTEKERSLVEIYETKGKLYGKILKIFTNPGEDPDPLCENCPEDDERYHKKIIGMEIIKDLKKNANEYSDGTILDPETGKIYRCKIWLEENDLKVRGYWGPFYRTQTWKRVN